MSKWKEMKVGDDVSITFEGKIEETHHLITSKDGIKSSVYSFTLDTDKVKIYLEITSITK